MFRYEERTFTMCGSIRFSTTCTESKYLVYLVSELSPQRIEGSHATIPNLKQS